MRTFIAILAGGKTDAKIKEVTGIEDKALLRYRGKSLLDIVHEACQEVRKKFRWSHVEVEVYGGKSIGDHLLRIKAEQDGTRFCQTPSDTKLFDVVEQVLADKKDEDLVIFLGSDLPFIKGESLARLIFRVAQKSGIHYPIILEDYIPLRYRRLQTFRKTRTGRFTGGNVIPGKVKDFRKGLTFARNLLANRKNPLKMASQFGFGMLVSVLFGLWSPERISEEVLAKSGVLVEPFYATDYGMSVDIDSYKDFDAIIKRHE